MELSYSFRIVCWTLFSLGILRLAFGLASAWMSRMLRSRIAAQSARWQEKYYFVTALLPDAAALVLAVAVTAPAFGLHESNPNLEHVGLFCIAVASITAGQYGVIAWRGMRLAFNMRLNSRVIPTAAESPDSALLAVKGLLRTRIVASPEVMSGNLFSREALEVAMAHEESHRRHHDNFKLFLLSSVSRFGHTGSAVQTRRRAAERAADDDAVSGGKERAILLSEALVAAARAVSRAAPPALAMELMPFEWELESRVDRLLHQELRSHPSRRARFHLALVLTGFSVIQASVCVFIATSHRLAECIVHLG